MFSASLFSSLFSATNVTPTTVNPYIMNKGLRRIIHPFSQLASDRKHLKKLLGNVNGKKNSNRLLISVTVPGSFGPIRFLGNHDDAVSSVVRGALKRYAREGRVPAVGSDARDFVFYRAYTGSDALNPSAAIGDCGGRDFVLCKKQQVEMGKVEIVGGGRGGNCCKEWMFQSVVRKIWRGPARSSRVGEQEAADVGSAALLVKMVSHPAAWIPGSVVDQQFVLGC